MASSVPRSSGIANAMLRGSMGGLPESFLPTLAGGGATLDVE